MKRTELRKILTEAGIENPSKEVIDAVLDAFAEEQESFKTNAQNEKAELEKQINELKTASTNNIDKSEYDKVVKEKEELANTIVLEKKKNIIRKYKGDEDFLDVILSKVDAGKDDNEFEKNVESFIKENPKFSSVQVMVNSNGDITPKTTNTNEIKDMRSAINDFYKNK